MHSSAVSSAGEQAIIEFSPITVVCRPITFDFAGEDVIYGAAVCEQAKHAGDASPRPATLSGDVIQMMGGLGASIMDIGI
jgi:hypothetical protein